MKRIPVDSTNVASVGYDPPTQTLEIEFHSGGIYQYFDIPQTVYDELLKAGSVGKFLNAHIKGSYRYARV
ncbi:KTSC domain-containing protein [candidate division LCP-89 bacterium B3_LCP]|uniref:KTSC domain-containing protein n=1 Tax=candidate division LCP-89 bacterium B3_LCP TaxID=2012998 RepID=A0A532UW07_UNCL8|nr:MAG: KTSC domain-containing protein [candidate division LCP-89 bacterium B3_LCP]